MSTTFPSGTTNISKSELTRRCCNLHCLLIIVSAVDCMIYLRIFGIFALSESAHSALQLGKPFEVGEAKK